MIDFKKVGISDLDPFSGMLPEELVRDFDEKTHLGFGITDDDKAIGCGVFAADDDSVEIIWMYVDPEYRGQGLARELLHRACEGTEDGDNTFISARLLVPTHSRFADFLRYEGFFVREDLSIDAETAELMGEDTVYVAFRGKNAPGIESIDDAIMSTPGMEYIYPRFAELEDFFNEHEYDADIIFETGGLPYVEVTRPKCVVRFFIMKTGEADTSENFMLSGRSSVDIKKNQVGKMDELMEIWSVDHPITSVGYNKETGVVDFFAAALISGGMPPESEIESFVETVIFDVETFVDFISK